MAELTLLDAYALVALLTGERAAPRVRELIREGGAAIPTINLAEAVDVLRRRYGIAGDRVRNAIGGLTERPLAVIDVDERLALTAGGLRATHYRRSTRPLSLADYVLLASAGPDDRIATADRHLLAVAADEGVGSLALPRADAG